MTIKIGNVLKTGAVAAPATWVATHTIPYLAERFGGFAEEMVSAALRPETGTAVNGLANIAMSMGGEILTPAANLVAQGIAYATLGAATVGLSIAAYNSSLGEH